MVPSAYFRHGALVQSTPIDPSCQNCREPLTRFPFASGQFHPAAASPSSVSRLVRGSPSSYQSRPRPSRPAGEEVFQFFVRRLSLNALNLLDLGASVKGRYPATSLSPNPPLTVHATALKDISLDQPALRMRRTWWLGFFRHGALSQSTPIDPSCQNIPRTVDPLSIRIRPVSPGRRVASTVSRLTRGSPSSYQSRPRPSRPTSEEVFKFFVRRLSRNALNLLGLGASRKGRYPAFRSANPAAVRSGDSPKGYQPLLPASTPGRELPKLAFPGMSAKGRIV